MAYIGDELSLIPVGKLTVFTILNVSTFAFERIHDFWVRIHDKIEINITAGTRNIVLKEREVIFHRPDRFHNVKALVMCP